MAPYSDVKLKAASVGARDIVLGAKVTAGEAFTSIALACLQHFAANRDAVAAGNVEGVHQMRVGLRRLAAAMSFFKPLLGDGESRRIKGELTWLLGELGPVRDLDVMIDESVAPLQRERIDGTAVTALKSELQTRRRTVFAQAKEAIGSARYRRTLRATALWITDGAWAANRESRDRGARLRRRRIRAPRA